MPRSSTNSSDEDDSSEEGYPTLPILTQVQRRRFIKEQQRIIRKLIRDFYSDQTVHYTLFDTPKIVHDDALGDCQARSVRPLACLGYCVQRYGTIPLF